MESMDNGANVENVGRVDEGEAFVATLLAASPSQLTACRGWTVHEVTAHLAAGSEEIADLIESHLAGAVPRPTRSFDEREASYRAMDDPTLRRHFFEQVERSKQARQRLARDADDTVLFTGRAMTAAELVRIRAANGPSTAGTSSGVTRSAGRCSPNPTSRRTR